MNYHTCTSIQGSTSTRGQRKWITHTHILEKPDLYLDEMAVFLWDDFQTMVTTSSIRRALVAKRWSKKTSRQRAREQNADLRDYYLQDLSDFYSYHLVYVGEPGVVRGLDSGGPAGNQLKISLLSLKVSSNVIGAIMKETPARGFILPRMVYQCGRYKRRKCQTSFSPCRRGNRGFRWWVPEGWRVSWHIYMLVQAKRTPQGDTRSDLLLMDPSPFPKTSPWAAAFIPFCRIDVCCTHVHLLLV